MDFKVSGPLSHSLLENGEHFEVRGWGEGRAAWVPLGIELGDHANGHQAARGSEGTFHFGSIQNTDTKYDTVP